MIEERSVWEGGRAVIILLFKRFAAFPWRESALLLFVFMALRTILIRMTILEPESFQSPVIFVEMLKSLSSWGWVLFPSAMVAGTLVWCWRRILFPWSQWEHGTTVRILVCAAALVLAWPIATYDFNFYVGQWHLADRLLLAFSFVMLCWRPVFILPFLAILIPTATQFTMPRVVAATWSAPDQSIHCLTLFAAFYLIALVGNSNRSKAFVILFCCMVALHYWPSGFTKFRSGWVLRDHLEFLLPNSYANGWFKGVSQEAIVTWTERIGVLSPVLRWTTLIAECGCLLFLASRRIALGLLVLWMAFHTGVFLATGICFWQWVLLEACLFLVIITKRQVFEERIFSLSTGVIAFGLIFSSYWWLRPASLTWFDARATYTYLFYAEGESGERYQLPPRFFAPYDYQFTLGGFGYLSEEPVLGIAWGATSRPIADRLAKAVSTDDFLGVERELSVDEYDSVRSGELKAFIQKFVSGVNEHPGHKHRFRAVQAPRLLWTFGGAKAYDYQEPIRQVEIVQVSTFFNGANIEEVRRRRVSRFDIP